MAIIDDEGRLFGVVNVVDALVVLVVLATLVAGLALVTGGDGGPTTAEPTRYALVAYDVPLGSDAASLAPNETLTARSGAEALPIADVYRSFTPNGSVHVVAAVGYTGSFTVDGGPRYGGDEIAVRTDSYAVTADVLAVNESAGTIPTRSERVVLFANVSNAVAADLEPGTTATIGDTEVARITAVEQRSTGNERTRIAVGASVTVRDREPVAAFDGEALRLGNRLTIVTDRAMVPGRVAAIGTDDPAAVDDR